MIPTGELLLGGLALALLGFAWALVRPYRLELSVQGRADARSFAAGGGLALGPLALTAAVASGVPAVALVSLFGRTVAKLTSASTPGLSPDELRAALARLVRHVDPLELALFLLLDEGRHLTIRELRGLVRGGLADPVGTAFVAGFLSALGGVLAPLGRLDWEPDWSLVDRGELQLSCVVEARPAYLLFELFSFSLSHVTLRAAPAPQPA